MTKRSSFIIQDFAKSQVLADAMVVHNKPPTIKGGQKSKVALANQQKSAQNGIGISED